MSYSVPLHQTRGSSSALFGRAREVHCLRRTCSEMIRSEVTGLEAIDSELMQPQLIASKILSVRIGFIAGQLLASSGYLL